MNTSEPQITCVRCLMDSSISDIYFNGDGICKYCMIHDELERLKPLDETKLKKTIESIKLAGAKQKYDCIVGVSGGRDSSYLLHSAVKLGLRPLAVHFDNGWNSEIAVNNIKQLLTHLNVELITIVADWEEFKSIQKAFLLASVPDVDIPTDYAIYSVLYQVAEKYKIKYILNGHSFRTEGTVPISWTYMDGRYFMAVVQKHSQLKKIESFKTLTLLRLFRYSVIRGIKEVRLLEMLNYQKKDVDELLKTQFGWKDYGGHHQENSYTKFVQTYYLPLKFSIDKRIVALSTQIRTNLMKREEAVKQLATVPAVIKEKELLSYVLKKLDLSPEEFDKIIQRPIKSHRNYSSYLPYIQLLKWPLKQLASLNILPHILYLKYARQ